MIGDEEFGMLIDCDTCAVRGPACADCVITVLLGAPPTVTGGSPEAALDLDGAERAAIAVLAGSGLVPPLRLVHAESGSSGAGSEAEVGGSAGSTAGGSTAGGQVCRGTDGERRAAEAG
jgi:hypothetical protein